jgi:acetate kinase
MSVYTTMGLTLLEGLVMGTRSGDVDPGVFGCRARPGQGRSALALGLLVPDNDGP